jgi:hypothetical protein
MGCPANGKIFFFGNRTLPPLAGMMQTHLLILSSYGEFHYPAFVRMKCVLISADILAKMERRLSRAQVPQLGLVASLNIQIKLRGGNMRLERSEY